MDDLVDLVDPFFHEFKVFDDFASAASWARTLALTYSSETGVVRCDGAWKVRVSPFIRAVYSVYGLWYDHYL